MTIQFKTREAYNSAWKSINRNGRMTGWNNMMKTIRFDEEETPFDLVAQYANSIVNW